MDSFSQPSTTILPATAIMGAEEQMQNEFAQQLRVYFTGRSASVQRPPMPAATDEGQNLGHHHKSLPTIELELKPTIRRRDADRATELVARLLAKAGMGGKVVGLGHGAATASHVAAFTGDSHIVYDKTPFTQSVNIYLPRDRELLLKETQSLDTLKGAVSHLALEANARV